MTTEKKPHLICYFYSNRGILDAIKLSIDSPPGLPDGKFSNQKYQFGKILEGFGMKKVGIFYEHLEYCMASL
jgi:hypothetical protein